MAVWMAASWSATAVFACDMSGWSLLCGASPNWRCGRSECGGAGRDIADPSPGRFDEERCAFGYCDRFCVAAQQDSARDQRAQECRGWFDEIGDPQKGARDLRIDMCGTMRSGDIGIGE